MPGQTQLGKIDWRLIANHVPGRSNKACRKRWCQSIGATSRSGHWSPEEDYRLADAVDRYGPAWSRVAASVQTRNGDQCLKRWRDTLDPKLNHNPWTAEEDMKLQESVQEYGQNWTRISSEHPYNRSALAVRHRYRCLRNKHSVARQRLEAGPFLFLGKSNYQTETQASHASNEHVTGSM